MSAGTWNIGDEPDNGTSNPVYSGTITAAQRVQNSADAQNTRASIASINDYVIEAESRMNDRRKGGNMQKKKEDAPSKKQPANKKSRAPKNTSAAKLLNQIALNPKITHKQLGKANNVSQQAVSQMLKRYGINDKYLESFKENRADILAGIQETVAGTLSEADIKKASVRDRTILMGTLYDKERLERGQSTSNSSVFFQIVAESDQA